MKLCVNECSLTRERGPITSITRRSKLRRIRSSLHRRQATVSSAMTRRRTCCCSWTRLPQTPIHLLALSNRRHPGMRTRSVAYTWHVCVVCKFMTNSHRQTRHDSTVLLCRIGGVGRCEQDNVSAPADCRLFNSHCPTWLNSTVE